ncbi:MAG: hypothetical protein H6742_03285 [Alphaproteobacteria bacterium]|nr:hypothetical protein [Alphaproteobacteria bacterium]
MGTLSLLLLAGCAPEDPAALPAVTCDDPDTVGVVDEPIDNAAAVGLCDGWCALRIESSVQLELPLTDAERNGLACVEVIEGSLGFSGEGAEGVPDVGLDRLRFVDGALGFNSLGSATGFQGLTSVQWVAADLFVVDTRFTDLAGLPALESLGGVSVFNNPQLVDISGLNQLAVVEAAVMISGNDCLPPEPIDALLARLGEDGYADAYIDSNGPCEGAR